MAIRPHVPGFPLPWMLQGSSLGLPKKRWKTVRFCASSDSRSDSRAGSRVSPATRITPSAMANGMARLE